MSGRPYPMKELRGIVEYIKERKCYGETKGRKMWVDFANSNATTRTWQSLKETFLKRILPDIHNPYYKVSADELRSFRTGSDMTESDRKLEVRVTNDLPMKTRSQEKSKLSTTTYNGDAGNIAGEESTGKETSAQRDSVETVILHNHSPCYKSSEDILRVLESPEKDAPSPSKSIRDVFTYSEPLTPMIQEILHDFASDESETEITKKVNDNDTNLPVPHTTNVENQVSVNNPDNAIIGMGEMDKEKIDSNPITDQQKKKIILTIKKIKKQVEEPKNSDATEKDSQKNIFNNKKDEESSKKGSEYEIKGKKKRKGSNKSAKKNKKDENPEKNTGNIIELSGKSEGSEFNKITDNKENTSQIENTQIIQNTGSTDCSIPNNQEAFKKNLKDKEERITNKVKESAEKRNAKRRVSAKSTDTNASKMSSKDVTDKSTNNINEDIVSLQTNSNGGTSSDERQNVDVNNKLQLNKDTIQIHTETTTKRKIGSKHTNKEHLDKDSHHTEENSDKDSHHTKEHSDKDTHHTEEHSDKDTHHTENEQKMKLDQNTLMEKMPERYNGKSPVSTNQDDSLQASNPCLQSVSLFIEQKVSNCAFDKRNGTSPDNVVLLLSHTDSESSNTFKISPKESNKQQSKALAKVFGYSHGDLNHNGNRRFSPTPAIPDYSLSLSSESSNWTSDEDLEYVQPPEKNRNTRRYINPGSRRIVPLEQQGGLVVAYKGRVYPLIKNERNINATELKYMSYKPDRNTEDKVNYWKNKYFEERKRSELLAKHINKDSNRKSTSVESVPLAMASDDNVSRNAVHKPDVKTGKDIELKIARKDNVQPDKDKDDKSVKIRIHSDDKEVAIEGHWQNMAPILSEVMHLFEKEPLKTIHNGNDVAVISSLPDDDVKNRVSKMEDEIFREIEEIEKRTPKNSNKPSSRKQSPDIKMVHTVEEPPQILKEDSNSETKLRVENNVNSRKRGRPKMPLDTPQTEQNVRSHKKKKLKAESETEIIVNEEKLQLVEDNTGKETKHSPRKFSNLWRNKRAPQRKRPIIDSDDDSTVGYKFPSPERQTSKLSNDRSGLAISRRPRRIKRTQ